MRKTSPSPWLQAIRRGEDEGGVKGGDVGGVIGPDCGLVGWREVSGLSEPGYNGGGAGGEGWDVLMATDLDLWAANSSGGLWEFRSGEPIGDQTFASPVLEMADN